MLHDFAITRRYTLFLDLPLTFDFTRLAANRPVIEFEPQFGARIGVLARHAPGSELVVIDARSMAAEPIARVMLPRRVPYGLHGLWLEM